MENQSTLDQINDPKNINQAISKDEEQEANDGIAGMLMAEDLILQLPSDHEQRNKWLKQFGQSAEARSLRNASAVRSEH